jgi:hypothetical protein
VSTENYVSDNTTVKKTSIFTDIAELITVFYVVKRSSELKPTDKAYFLCGHLKGRCYREEIYFSELWNPLRY